MMNPEREHSESLRIEVYLAGEMTPEQQIAFENDCESDPALQDLLEQHLLAKHIVLRSGEQNQKEQWQDLRAEMRASNGEVRFISKLRPYLIAAVVLSLAIWGGFLLFDNTPKSPENLFTEYYERPQAPERMGNSLVQAERYYRQGDFAQAIASYEALALDTSQNFNNSVYLYWGIAYLELSEADSALARFAELETLPEQRDWFTALTYLKQGKKDLGRNLLEQIVTDELHYYRQPASDLLSQLSQ